MTTDTDLETRWTTAPVAAGDTDGQDGGDTDGQDGDDSDGEDGGVSDGQDS